MENKKETRTPKWAMEDKYGVFAKSDGEKHLEMAMSIGGKAVRRLEDVNDEDFMRLTSMVNSIQAVMLKEYFRRYPDKKAEMDAFAARGGVA